MQIQNAWYRISAKALIFNEEGKILLCKEDNGKWEFPGGGLDHGENHTTCLQRELQEEMGLTACYISEKPEFFITTHKPQSKTRPWIANIFYKVEVENLDFTPSDECVEIGFFDTENVKSIEVFPNVKDFFENYKL